MAKLNKRINGDKKGQNFKQVEDIKSDFITIASHQLRTPIAAVRWSLDTLLSGRTGKLSVKQQEVVGEAYQNNQFMIKVVNDLLRVSRIEEKGIILVPELTALLPMVQEVAKAYQDLAQAFNCQIILTNKVQSSKSRRAFVDKLQIKTIIESLVDNSVRYSRTRGTVKISLKKLKDFLLLEVADTGIGIPRAEQKLVFSKFFRGTNAVKVQPEGLGLDLYMAKKIVESSGGKINFSSLQNRGSNFKIYLPSKKLKVDSVKVTKSAEDEATKILKKEREFVSITVHELKAPLSIAKWSLEMLQSKKIGELNQDQLDLVAQVYRGNERLLVLVRDLLNLAKLQDGQFEITPKNISLVTVVSDVVKSFSQAAADKQITLNWSKNFPAKSLVVADEARVAQVVTNLISNAIKYTKITGLVEVKVVSLTGNQLKQISKNSATIDLVNTHSTRGYLVVSVRDTGIGISQQDQAKLFTRFFRSRTVLESATEGTGLGLYITKSIVNLHHGDIWFTSQLGKGSTFYFSLPIA